MSVQIQARDLMMRFGRKVLFRNLSFSIADGEVVAVTGANGSGKSTLVKIMAGLLRPYKGEIELNVGGKRIPFEERALLTGLVAPYLNVYDGFSLRENLQFIARARTLPEAATRIPEVIEQVQLKASADAYVQTYSSGMRQRARFAAALLANPPILLLDEPTSNLDETGKRMVWEVIRAAKADGKLVIVATNEADEAAKCDRRIAVAEN